MKRYEPDDEVVGMWVLLNGSTLRRPDDLYTTTKITYTAVYNPTIDDTAELPIVQREPEPSLPATILLIAMSVAIWAAIGAAFAWRLLW